MTVIFSSTLYRREFIMFNGQQSPIMVIHGETAKKMIEQAESPKRNHTKEVNIARERLRKAGMFK